MHIGCGDECQIGARAYELERIVFDAGVEMEPRLYADVGPCVCVDGEGERGGLIEVTLPLWSYVKPTVRPSGRV